MDDGVAVSFGFFAVGILWLFIAQLLLLSVRAVREWMG